MHELLAVARSHMLAQEACSCTPSKQAATAKPKPRCGAAVRSLGALCAFASGRFGDASGRRAERERRNTGGDRRTLQAILLDVVSGQSMS